MATLNDLQTVNITGQGIGSYTEPVYEIEGLDFLVSLRDLIKFILSRLGADDQYVASAALAGNILQLNMADGSQVTADLSALAGAATVTTNATLTGDGSPGLPLGLADNAVTAPKIASDAVTTTKIANGNVTLAKVQNIASARLLGRSTAGAGVVEELQIGAGLQLAAGTLSATGGGGGGGTTKTTLVAGGTSMVITYEGASAPTLTNPSAGAYVLNCPAGTRPRGFDWIGDNGDVDGSGDMTLTIDSADSENLFYVIQVINRGNNQLANLATLGINVAQTNPSAGQVVSTLTSMNGFGASGFRVLGRFA